MAREMLKSSSRKLCWDDFAFGRKVAVVHGLGGIGKTQLVVEFARKHEGRFSAIFWLDGSSEASLKQSFVEAAQR